MQIRILPAVSILALVSSLAAASESESPRDTLTKAQLAYESGDAETLHELTAPHQRRPLDDQAIARAESRCKDDSRRSWMPQALKFAENLKPTYEQDGQLAVYDLSIMGFSGVDQKLRMIRLEGKWYLLQ